MGHLHGTSTSEQVQWCPTHIHDSVSYRVVRLFSHVVWHDCAMFVHAAVVLHTVLCIWRSMRYKMLVRCWSTPQAHNHNADLIKHHKDAIDGLQAASSTVGSGSLACRQELHSDCLQYLKPLWFADSPYSSISLVPKSIILHYNLNRVCTGSGFSVVCHATGRHYHLKHARALCLSIYFGRVEGTCHWGPRSLRRACGEEASGDIYLCVYDYVLYPATYKCINILYIYIYI